MRPLHSKRRPTLAIQSCAQCLSVNRSLTLQRLPWARPFLDKGAPLTHPSRSGARALGGLVHLGLAVLVGRHRHHRGRREAVALRRRLLLGPLQRRQPLHPRRGREHKCQTKWQTVGTPRTTARANICPSRGVLRNRPPPSAALLPSPRAQRRCLKRTG